MINKAVEGDIKIVNHLSVNENLLFELQIVKQGEKEISIGYLHGSLCKNIIPVKLCDYYEKFINYK